MTDRVYLHVGAPKAGTTYLQRLMEDNRAALAEAGVLVVGDRHIDRVHAGMAVRQDPRLENLPPEASRAWKRLTDQIRHWDGAVAVLSYELFAGASEEQVTTALRDLEGIEVHIVITARDLARAVPSAWQERLKFALTTPLEEWVPRPESAGPRAEWGWRTMDPAGVAARWGASLPADQVHIVTVPREHGDELWHRFARACGISEVPVDLTLRHANTSLGVAAAEVLRRANERLPEELGTNREQARWIRDVLANDVLAELDREPMGLTDVQFEDAARRSGEAIDRISAAGYDVVGDLEDIRAVRREARTPGQVPDAELLDVAVGAVMRLLSALREAVLAGERRPAPSPEPAAGPPPAPPSRARLVARRLVRAAAVGRVEQELAEARERIARLEADLVVSRELQFRVAELDDLVAELLLPPNVRDRRLMGQALRRYRSESL